MSSVLIQAGYKYKEPTSVWSRQDYTGIAYNDGDEIELRIASIIDNATDISVLSDELRPHCTDWPSLYHLSNTRANILRPFEADLCGDVLEIGAGLGAITRYLGECGGNVLAVEGTLRRAAIARARTRDLNNVTVVSDKFDDFQCDKKFDIVTLIGVLEYANLFTTGENPTLTLLERARSFLKPKGKLIIAIENQLGLKYFAGAPEDHFGIPMYGIEGRYRKGQAQTFGRKQIAGLIKRAGFRSCEFLAPFPDYKLPLSIITERGFSYNTFDSSALACQSVCHDPQLPPIMNFSPELVWPTIVNNKLALDLSNSFLIVTSPAEEDVLVSSSTLAWHYTTGRRKELCKSTEFAKVENNQIEVVYKRLDLRASNPVIGDLLQNHLPERAGYRHGNVLLQEFIHVVAQEGWRIEDVCTLLRKWLNFIATLSTKQGQTVDISDPSSQLPGNFFDYIPSNIILANNGFLHVIDKEWTVNEKLEVGYLTFRSLLILFNLRKFGSPENKNIKTFHDLIIYAIKGLGWSIADDKIESWITIESKIQSEVLGSPISIGNFKDSLKRTVQIASLHQSLSSKDNEIHNLSSSLSQRTEETEQQVKTITTLNQSLTSKDQQLLVLKKQLEDTHKDYLNLRSWRITSPLRSINKFITKFINTLNFTFLKKKYNKIFNFKKNLIETSINTKSNLGEYADKILSIADNNSGGLNINFVPRSKINHDFSNNPLKAIAFYLPQFHPIPENDKWWGRGFTEWTNVSKSMPQFLGHYQPHLPGDLGFYDLRLVEVQSLQIEIAKQYGIYGFCYHYYWFNGKRLLHKPLEQFLSNKNLDFPFCLCWANENWTRGWDGKEHDILINQNHSPEDDINFISNIASALRDSRYIRFNKKPIIIVYRTTLLPDPKATALRWREYCLKNGVGEIYLIAVRSFGFKDPVSIGFDASIEFPPHEANSRELNNEINFINSKFQGKVYDFSDLANSYLKIYSDKYPILKTVCPGWDNSARKPGKGHIFYGSGTVPYSRWLRGACEQTIKSAVINKNHPPFIFINAWNEWAEGAHLEPDRKYGFANLHATANILQSFTPLKAEIENEINNSQNNFKKTSNGAVVLHFFYGDLLEELLPYLERVKNLDLFVSLGPNIALEQIDQLKKIFPNLYLVAFQNKGRDVMPFIKILKVLEKFKYQYGCKIHTKKSPQFSYGDKLRSNMLESLLGSENEVKKFIKTFTGNINAGLMAPAKMFLDLSDLNKNSLNRFWLDKLLIKIGKSNLIGKYSWQFVAGTAFWFRVDSLNFLSSLDLSDNDFEEELGQLDGTLAHAIERIIPLGIVQSGYSILKK